MATATVAQLPGGGLLVRNIVQAGADDSVEASRKFYRNTAEAYPDISLNGVEHAPYVTDATTGKAVYDYALSFYAVIRECQVFTKTTSLLKELGLKANPLLSSYAEKCGAALPILTVARIIPVSIDMAKGLDKVFEDPSLANFWGALGKVADAFGVYLSAFLFIIPAFFMPAGVAFWALAIAAGAGVVSDTVDLTDEVVEFQKYRPAADVQEIKNMSIYNRLNGGGKVENLSAEDRASLHVEGALRSYQRAALMKAISKTISISLGVFAMVAQYAGFALGAGAILAGLALFNVVLAVIQAVYKNSIDLKFAAYKEKTIEAAAALVDDDVAAGFDASAGSGDPLDGVDDQHARRANGVLGLSSAAAADAQAAS